MLSLITNLYYSAADLNIFTKCLSHVPYNIVNNITRCMYMYQ